MSPIAAAMGIAAWPTLSDRVNRRIEILEYYRVKLIPAGWRGQAEKFGKTNAWLSVFAFPESATIQQVRKVYDLLAEKSIEVRPFWNPLHLHPLFTGCKFFGGNIAQNLFARGICLPSSNQLSQQDLDTVISTLHTV
jgi:pyridoxal phosphate-dependent aminotransferase EpsN